MSPRMIAMLFDEEDQRVCRVIAKIIEELLQLYNIRQHISETVADLLEDPDHIDPLLRKILPPKTILSAISGRS